MQTLKYFLSETGIQDFQKWYLAKASLQSIWHDLDNYVLMLLATRWTAEREREQLRTNIREYLELYIQCTYKKTAEEIFQDWITEVNKYCFQGGYGYRFAYPDAPHHWVIKPQFYENVSSIPEEVSIASCIIDKYIVISDSAYWEHWGN